MSKFSAMKLSSETPQQMKISHPSTGLPLIARDGREAFITVLSLDSKVAKDFDREVLDRRVSRRIRPTASEIEQENLLKAAKLVASLPWFLVDPTTLEAIEEPCTEANARELFSECPWVLEQVLEYAAARANFMKN